MVVPLDTWSQHVGLLISYYITFSFWSAQTLALSLISRNIAGQTKKSVAIAVNFIIWSTGNAIGKVPLHPVIFTDFLMSKCDAPRPITTTPNHMSLLLNTLITRLTSMSSLQGRKCS